VEVFVVAAIGGVVGNDGCFFYFFFFFGFLSVGSIRIVVVVVVAMRFGRSMMMGMVVRRVGAVVMPASSVGGGHDSIY